MLNEFAMKFAETLVLSENNLGKMCDVVRTQFGVDVAHVYIGITVNTKTNDKVDESKNFTMSLESLALLQRSGATLSFGDGLSTSVDELLDNSEFREVLQTNVLNAVKIALEEVDMRNAGLHAMLEHTYKNLGVEDYKADAQVEFEKSRMMGYVLYHGPCIDFGKDNI